MPFFRRVAFIEAIIVRRATRALSAAKPEPRDRSTPNAYARMPIVAFAGWDPVRDLLAIQQRLDRFAPGPAGWVPPIDVHETADEFVITAELPGLRRDDIQIQAIDGRLQLSGVRRETGVPCEQYHRIEHAHGGFSR